MANEALRQAIRSVGMTHAQVAERLGVDVKTVDRWVSPGRVPHRRFRQALVEIVGVDGSRLWPVGDRSSRSATSVDVDELLRTVATLEAERRAYEQALLRMAEHSSQNLQVTERTIEYEIGETASEDLATDTWVIQTLDASPGVLWWVFAIGASGERVPQKQSVRQLDLMEAHELLEDGQVLGVRVLNLHHYAGKVWALAIFDRELPRRTLRIRWGWVGTWNMLRDTCQDRSGLDLSQQLQSIDWGSITVRFSFPPSAESPEVEPRSMAASMVRTLTRYESGRTVYTFQMDQPARAAYVWDLRVQSFSARPACRATPAQRL